MDITKYYGLTNSKQKQKGGETMDNWHKTDIKLRLDLMVDGEGLLDRVVKLKNAANEAAVLATGIEKYLTLQQPDLEEQSPAAPEDDK